jgi:hAT family C-terminal dimerisation region
MRNNKIFVVQDIWRDDDGDDDKNDDGTKRSDEQRQDLKMRSIRLALGRVRKRFAAPTSTDLLHAPLRFWRLAFESARKHGRPEMLLLVPLVLAYLSAPATSSASESTFSVAKAVKSAQRARLSPQHLEQETVIANNHHLFDGVSHNGIIEAALTKLIKNK